MSAGARRYPQVPQVRTSRGATPLRKSEKGDGASRAWIPQIIGRPTLKVVVRARVADTLTEPLHPTDQVALPAEGDTGRLKDAIDAGC
jgi:hypothetical protein